MPLLRKPMPLHICKVTEIKPIATNSHVATLFDLPPFPAGQTSLYHTSDTIFTVPVPKPKAIKASSMSKLPLNL